MKQGKISAAKSVFRRQIFPPSVVLSNVFNRFGLKKIQKEKEMTSKINSTYPNINRGYFFSSYIYLFFGFIIGKIIYSIMLPFLRVSSHILVYLSCIIWLYVGIYLSLHND